MFYGGKEVLGVEVNDWVVSELLLHHPLQMQSYIVWPDSDMRIVPLGSSSTNSKHWRVPQNSVIRCWGLVYFATQTKFVHNY